MSVVYLYVYIYAYICIHFFSINSHSNPLGQGSPTSGPWSATGPRPVRNWAAHQEVNGGRASNCCFPLLTLPPEPTLSVEKSPTKPVPAAKKVGDRCFRVSGIIIIPFYKHKKK